MVKIRAAKFGDIPEIARLAEEARRASTYSDRFGLDEKSLKRVAMECINQHAAKPGGGMILVADNGVCLEGFFVGFVRRLYECLDCHLASNLVWYASPAASPMAGAKMIRVFTAWAFRAEGPVIVRIGLSDAVKQSAAVGKVLERQGFHGAGLIYEKERS